MAGSDRSSRERMADKSPWRKAGESVRSGGSALAIPTILLTFPIVGALAGKFAGDYFGKPWILPAGLILGLVLAVWECVRVLRQLNRVNK